MSETEIIRVAFRGEDAGKVLDRTVLDDCRVSVDEDMQFSDYQASYLVGCIERVFRCLRGMKKLVIEPQAVQNACTRIAGHSLSALSVSLQAGSEEWTKRDPVYWFVMADTVLRIIERTCPFTYGYVMSQIEGFERDAAALRNRFSNLHVLQDR